jgi:methylglutaconyl-CoA hydratase
MFDPIFSTNSSAGASPSLNRLTIEHPRIHDSRMNETTVLVRVIGSLGTIELDRSGRRHALCRSTIAALQLAFSDLYQEKRARSVVLTGTGDMFCSGMDLHEIHETSQRAGAASIWHEDADAFRALIEAMLVFPKPIIASVNGPALGGGAGLVLASDIVVAVESATLGVPAPSRGLVAGLVAPLFAFRVGAGYTARYMLTGETITAKEAQRIGIFHETVVDTAALKTRVAALGEHFGTCSFEAIALTKRLVNEVVGDHLRAQLASGAAMTATSQTTDAAREGVSAFVEKRSPNWP